MTITLDYYLQRQRRSESEIPHIFVEGKSDRYMVDKLKYEIEKRRACTIQMRIMIPDELEFSHGTGGNRERVKQVAQAIVAQNSADKDNFIALYDREFVDFDWGSGDSIIDHANGTETYFSNQRLLRTCGHSAENYLFQQELLIDFFEQELQASSEISHKIRTIWTTNFQEMMSIAVALCIAIKKR